MAHEDVEDSPTPLSKSSASDRLSSSSPVSPNHNNNNNPTSPKGKKSSKSPKKTKSPKKPKKPSSERISSSSTKEKMASPKPKKPSSERIMSSTGKSPSGRRSRKSVSRRKLEKKGVHFKKTVGVNTIPNLDSYSQIEVTQVWFTADEYSMMEDECDQTATLLDAKRGLGVGLCPRGLEAWTMEGEQEKEWNVQEAVDRVWQAQLEQWQAAKDTAECWEFIRSEYLPASKRCSRDARTVGLKDEESIQSYLSTTRSVFRSYSRRMFGTQHIGTKSPKITLTRSASYDMPKNGKKLVGVGRNRSEIMTPISTSTCSSSSGSDLLQKEVRNSKFKSSLKASSVYTSDDSEEEETKKPPKAPPTGKSPNRKISRKISRVSRSKNSKNQDDRSIAHSYASTVESSIASSRKIVFRPKSKTKIPTSPVGSVTDGSTMDESTTSRRRRSHMSVCSDDSTRRRMLRTAGIRPLS